MLPIRTILYPTDFSPHAACAFPMAFALARDYGARLIIAHVFHSPAPAHSEMAALHPPPAELAEELKARLQEIRPPDPAVPVEPRVCEGDPAREIIALARRTCADVIVMGTHGRTGLTRVLMGSVTEDLLRHAPCPVLTLKTPFPEAAPAPAPEEAVHA
jgi:nucleotide-binding universal stress UspA family protein